MVLMMAFATPKSFAAYFPDTLSDGQILYYNILDATAKTVEVTSGKTVCTTSGNSTSCEWIYYGEKAKGNITIPSTVIYNGQTYTVTSIGYYAFRECDSLINVIIPNTVTKIDNCAFIRCYNLESVYIPSSVTIVGQTAFDNCYSINSLHIPESVTSIGYAAFYNVQNVEYNGSATGSPWDARNINAVYWNGLYFTDGTKSTLVGCDKNLKDIIIPNTVTTIGERAFAYAKNAKRIFIPNTVSTIGNYAFSFCNNLQYVDINRSIPPSISSYTLSGFIEKTKIKIPCGTRENYINAWSNATPSWVASVDTFHFTYYYDLQLSTNDSLMGHIEVDSNCTTQTVTLNAVGHPGYTFAKWNDGTGINPRNIELTKDTMVQAIFAILIRDTTILHDTTFISVPYAVHDTTYINVPYAVHDTSYIEVPYAVHDTTYINVHDTTYIDVPYAVHDTTIVTDTVTLTEYVPVHDTTTVRDTTYLPVYIHDTTTVRDTTYLPVYLHDTTYINIHDTTYIDVPYAVHDTTYINVHDTTYIDVPYAVHDTTYITLTDTVTNTVYDTIDNFIHDTTIVTDTLWLTQYDTLWLHDTIIVHDTIYITQEGIGDVEAVNAIVYSHSGQIVVEGAEGHAVTLYDINGRLLATRQEEFAPLHFDVPASGTYMLRIGNLPARKVVVIR